MNKVAAWLVHLLTASGAVLGLLALQSALDGAMVPCFLWLGGALAVDAIDGPLARRLKVHEVVPRFDGAALDLIVDFLTYVFVPVVILVRWPLLPAALTWPLAAWVLVSSLYLFCKRDLKTEDGHFIGFPALWNLVVFAIVFLRLTPWIAAGLVLSLGALSFAPIKVPHPLRAAEGRTVTLVALAVWAAASLAILLGSPDLAMWATIVWAMAIGYFVSVSISRSSRKY